MCFDDDKAYLSGTELRKNQSLIVFSYNETDVSCKRENGCSYTIQFLMKDIFVDLKNQTSPFQLTTKSMFNLAMQETIKL